MGIQVDPTKARHQEMITTLRVRLGEAASAAAWAEGRAMSMEQAIAYALNTTSSATTHSRPSTTI
jgi:hypothetical protein